MNALSSALLALTLVLGACSDSEPGPPGSPAQTPEELLRLLSAGVDAIAARPEHAATQVTVQALLVGVSGGVPGVERSPGEAELLAAELLARAQAGEDFDLLVKNYTNDVHPGVYTLTTGPDDPPRTFARASLAAGVLGDVAWRLEIGELGVAPYQGSGTPSQASKSPFGFHLVKRLE